MPTVAVEAEPRVTWNANPGVRSIQVRPVQAAQERAVGPYREGWLEPVALQCPDETENEIERLRPRGEAMHLGACGLGAGCESFEECRHGISG